MLWGWGTKVLTDPRGRVQSDSGLAPVMLDQNPSSGTREGTQLHQYSLVIAGQCLDL